MPFDLYDMVRLITRSIRVPFTVGSLTVTWHLHALWNNYTQISFCATFFQNSSFLCILMHPVISICKDTLHFKTLNSICHFFAHSTSCIRSDCSSWHLLYSSSNFKMELCKPLFTSSVRIRNSIVNDPCGTAVMMVLQYLVVLQWWWWYSNTLWYSSDEGTSVSCGTPMMMVLQYLVVQQWWWYFSTLWYSNDDGTPIPCGTAVMMVLQWWWYSSDNGIPLPCGTPVMTLLQRDLPFWPQFLKHCKPPCNEDHLPHISDTITWAFLHSSPLCTTSTMYLYFSHWRLNLYESIG